MSWETKTDFCGMTGTNIPLETKTAILNKSRQYLEKHGKDGDYKTTKPFGERAAPQNTYTITGELTITGKPLGAVVDVGGVKYARESISWSTGADAEPTLSASAKQVEAGASTVNSTHNNKFVVPAFVISHLHVAQIPAFIWTGSTAVPAFEMPTANSANADCELIECGGEMSCTVKTNDKNGLPQWHDVTNGHVVINITIAQYGNTVPTVSAAAGWDISSPLTSDDPDSDMPTWKMTLSRPLVKSFRTAS